MQNITNKQQKVLNFIKHYYSTNSATPTLQEIAENLDMDSRASVLYHLKRLEEKDFIYRTNKKRGIILKQCISFTTIPILGEANAGTPLASGKEEELGELQIDARIIRNKKNLYAVKIKGDSMNLQKVYINNVKDTAILKDNNYAIIDKDASYTFGDAVLAIINDAATIKVLSKAGNHIALVPNSTNKSHTPIYIQENDGSFINGKVVYALENPNVNL